MDRQELVEKARAIFGRRVDDNGLVWWQDAANEATDFAAALIAAEREKPMELLRRLVAAGPPRSKYGHQIIDWACRECAPASDLLEEGFLCPYHDAGAALRRAPEKLEPVVSTSASVSADRAPQSTMPPAPSSAQRKRAEELCHAVFNPDRDDDSPRPSMVDAMLAFGAERYAQAVADLHVSVEMRTAAAESRGRRAAFAEAAQAAVQAFRRWYVYAEHIDGPDEAALKWFTDRLDEELSAAARPAEDRDSHIAKGPHNDLGLPGARAAGRAPSIRPTTGESAVGQGQDTRGAESVSAPLSPAAQADVLERAAEILDADDAPEYAKQLRQWAHEKLRARPSAPGDWAELVTREWMRMDWADSPEQLAALLRDRLGPCVQALENIRVDDRDRSLDIYSARALARAALSNLRADAKGTQ